MILRAVFCLLFFALSTVITDAQPAKKNKSSSTVLFTVNKKPVHADEFIYLYKKNHQNPQEDFTTAKIEEYLNLYINFKLKVAEARRRGMDTTAAFRREFNQYREELRKPYMPGNGLADSLVRLTYERMKEEVSAGHILITLKPDPLPADTLMAYNRISEIRSKALRGEDFRQLATTYSEDPSAKMNKGDLGYFTAMQMVYQFENAAYTTSVGAISAPVRTRFGYHIVKVYDRRPARDEIEVAHIMIRTGDDHDNDQARNRIFSAYEQLQAGLNWKDLCREYSEDQATRDAGGKLRPFRQGMMSNVPEFERIAFELESPGAYSDPFQTQYGWHIVRLERKIPLAPFEEMASVLKNQVSRDERTQISKQALQRRLRADFGIQENNTAKNRLLSVPDSIGSLIGIEKHLGKSFPEQELFRLAGTSIPVSRFLAFLKSDVPASQINSRNLSIHYDQFIDKVLSEEQEKKIARENPEFRFLLNEYYEGILLFEIMEKEVWNKASEDSVGQHQFFTENRDKYTAGVRAKVSLYSSADQSAIEQLRKLNPASPDSRSEIQAYLKTNSIRTESGVFARDEKAVLQKLPWEAGMHTAENNGMHYLAWMKEVLPQGRMSFEEARPTVISDYQNHLEARWLTSLRKSHPVKVNTKGKKHVLSLLEKK